MTVNQNFSQNFAIWQQSRRRVVRVFRTILDRQQFAIASFRNRTLSVLNMKAMNASVIIGQNICKWQNILPPQSRCAPHFQIVFAKVNEY